MTSAGGLNTLDPVEHTRQALRAALNLADDVDLGWVRAREADSWSLDDAVLRLLVALVDTMRPRHILEFGAGTSTKVLARVCAGLRPPCRISSVDHDPELARLTALELSQQEGADSARILLAPLVARQLGDAYVPVYLIRPKQLASTRAVDLALIDGPPLTLGGRMGTLYQVHDVARPGTLVLLDDANRPAEREALHGWQDYLGDAIEVELLPDFPKGLAAVIVRTPVRTDDLPSYRQRRTTAAIRELAPVDSGVVLVDDYWLTDDSLGELRPMRLLEIDGEYVGPPADDAVAIADVERRRGAGAGLLVFTAPSFWWLEHYTELHAYLRRSFRCIAETERLIAFDLRTGPERPA